MSDRVFCDSNLLLYTFDCKDAKKQHIAKDIVLKYHNIISTQVINEVSNNLLKKFSFSNMQVKQFIDSCYKRYEVVSISKETFINACELRERYNLSYYDSLIVSSALEAKSTLLYSEDMQHQLKINKLTIINPFSILK